MDRGTRRTSGVLDLLREGVAFGSPDQNRVSQLRRDDGFHHNDGGDVRDGVYARFARAGNPCARRLFMTRLMTWQSV